jgi:uncharacterized protein (DUF433 family)
MKTAASWISKKPDRCGGDACVRDTRITVWGLVEARRLGASDAELLETFPGLTPADLEAAREYQRLNGLEIERNIWENQAVMEEQGGERRLALIVRGWQLGLPDEDIRDAFAPPLTAADLQAARGDYRARQDAFDASLPALLPEELSGGLEVHGPAVRRREL